MAATALLYPLMWTFFCVLSRVGPLLVMMPPIRGSSVPMQVRAYLAIGLAASITPLAMDNALTMPNSLVTIVIALVKEMLFGMMLGGIVMLLVNGLQMGAQIISSLASMDIAEVADPTNGQSSSVVAQLFTWLALAIFLLIGGHRALLHCCVDTFQVYPAGGVLAEEYWLLHASELIHHAAGIGLRAAAPAAVALILANLTTALLGRTLPQLNIMAIGFNINVLVLMWVLGVTIGIVGMIYQNELAIWIERTHAMFLKDHLAQGMIDGR
jgi:flagellar biosynthesis protein FliR